MMILHTLGELPDLEPRRRKRKLYRHRLRWRLIVLRTRSGPRCIWKIRRRNYGSQKIGKNFERMQLPISYCYGPIHYVTN
jgi:hypothetical protein